MNLQHRSDLVIKAFPLLEAKADENGTFSGYAATYNLDLQGDKILPGAFAQSIKDKRGQVPVFYNHNDFDWIGFSTSLAEDGKGLAITAQLAMKTAAGHDAYELLQAAAAIDYRVGMSIGFITKDFDWDGEVRVLKRIDLWEASITPFPAQPKAFVSDVKTSRDFEKRLREVDGFSRSDAKRILNAWQDFQRSSSGRPDDANPPLTRRLLSVL